MADVPSAVRRIFQTLISLAIQRCRLSGRLCRLTISLKCFRESDPPTLRISISDTGVGSSLEEFRTLDFGAAHAASLDRWGETYNKQCGNTWIYYTLDMINYKLLMLPSDAANLSFNICSLSIKYSYFHAQGLEEFWRDLNEEMGCCPSQLQKYGHPSSIWYTFQFKNRDQLTICWSIWHTQEESELDFINKKFMLCIHERDVHYYRLNLRETLFSTVRLKRLPSTCKHVGIFSGTEVCLSYDEENIDDFVAWVVHFVQKMLVLKAHQSWDILVDVIVEYKDNQGSRCEHFLSKSEVTSVQLPVSNIACLCSGLKDYILERRSHAEIACSSKREDLKAGVGHGSNSGACQNAGLEVEVAIVTVPMTTEPCCMRASSQTTQVLYFDEFSPSPISKSALNALEYIKWQFYGLKLKGIVMDRDGHAVLEWENVSFSHIDMAIHIFNRKVLKVTKQETSNRELVKKAVKAALDDLKTKYTGLFLSSRALKIQKYAPDLSRTIASLISSSGDDEFKGECATLLGLKSEDASNEMLELCIQNKLLKTIASNDRKHKAEKDVAPLLFMGGEECPEEVEGDEDLGILDLI